MINAKTYERITSNGSDYDVEIIVDFEIELIPAEDDNNVHEDIVATEIYDDYKVELQNRNNSEEDLIIGGKSLLNLIGLNINDIVEANISENFDKYKNDLIY